MLVTILDLQKVYAPKSKRPMGLVESLRTTFNQKIIRTYRTSNQKMATLRYFSCSKAIEAIEERLSQKLPEDSNFIDIWEDYLEKLMELRYQLLQAEENGEIELLYLSE